jgi:RNA polymerase sigma factor (sigma-70 family)
MQKALYERLNKKMLAVCCRYINNKMEAEDVFHDAFIKVFKNLATFRGGSLEGWIRRIMVNESINYYNRQIKDKYFEDIDDRHNDFATDTDAFDELSVADLKAMIARLPEGCRIVFNLFAIEGYEHEEIAKMLNISSGTSRSQLHRARQLLKTTISQLQN